jgi:hypothetical protein
MQRRWFAIALFAAVSTFTFAQDIPLTNWTVPPYHSGGSSSAGITTMTDVTPPRAFVGIQPCRVADTRGNGAPIQGGIFPNSGLRTWDLTGICGLPAGTEAISANFTVVAATGIPAGSFLLAWPTGQAPPPTAIMTYGPGQIISNAAIVPLGPGEQMNVNVSGSTHIVMDVNGYFSDTLQNTSNQFEVRSAGGVAIFGENTGSGYGVWGTSATGFGVVAGGGAGGVWATTASGAASGVYGQNTGGGYGVYGKSNGGFGVYGFSEGAVSNGVGVNGLGPGGAAGGSSNSGPAGVRGENLTFYGVMGVSRETAVAGFLVRTDGNNGPLGYLGAHFLGDVNYGVFAGGNYGGTGAKYFVEPHPEKAGVVIRYVSLEGNEAGTYFRGRGKFQNGVATIEVPEDFRLVTDPEGLTVNVTPIGEMATVAAVKIGLDRIQVRGSRDVEFSYMVNGVRKSHKHLTPIGPGSEYMPESAGAKIPLYLTEGQKAMLISNGTYKPDGTVNMETARRLGWDKAWEKRGHPAPQPTSN